MLLSFSFWAYLDPSNARAIDRCPHGVTPTEYFCRAGEGLDMFGMPKYVDWLYWQIPELAMVKYWKREFHRIVIDHSKARFLETNEIDRIRTEAVTGVPGYSMTLKESETNCRSQTNYYLDQRYNRGGSWKGHIEGMGKIQCRTDPAITVDVPATPAQEAQIEDFQKVVIIDCNKFEIARAQVDLTALRSGRATWVSRFRQVYNWEMPLARIGCLSIDKTSQSKYSGILTPLLK